MKVPIGRVVDLVRYPVKSMAGLAAEWAELGWHGLEGDRRFAFRRLGDEGGFPWLSASRFPGLLLYQPDGPRPSHVRTPSGTHLELRSPELAREIADRSGVSVEMMQLKHGIFDDATVSVIGLGTIAGIGREAGVGDLDRRRFRANIVLETLRPEPFTEDGWVGGVLLFGDEPAAAVSVTKRDERCMMVNLDPETAEQDGRVMKTVVRLNANYAGVYATVVRPGTLRVGQEVHLSAPA